MTYPKWFEKDGAKKLFNEQPTEIGWEPCNGHYDFALGVWIDDDPQDDINALRGQYSAKFGKKPFNGWDADTLKEKLSG